MDTNEPFLIFWEEGTSIECVNAMTRGIARVQEIAGVQKSKGAGMILHGTRWGEHTVKSWLSSATKPIDIFSVPSLDGASFLDAVSSDMGKENVPNAFAVAVIQKLFMHLKDETGTLQAFDIGGCATVGGGTVLRAQIPWLEKQDMMDMIQLYAMHEAGHIFGLVGGNRTEDVTQSPIYGVHCARMCVMRSNLSGLMVFDRRQLLLEPFCELCLGQLKK